MTQSVGGQRVRHNLATEQQQKTSSSQGGKVTDSWESCKWVILEDWRGDKGSQQAQELLDGESGVS